MRQKVLGCITFFALRAFLWRGTALLFSL